MSDLSQQLSRRRQALKMSCRALALRSGVSLCTVMRVLGGDDRVKIATLNRVAGALGVELRAVAGVSPARLRSKQADRMAEWIISLNQGNSSLEGQGISKSSCRTVRRELVARLLAGPAKNLWGQK